MAELNSLSLKNDANLVAYWRMEGNSNDSKGSANGTDTNITYSAANGKYGQGAGFGGSSRINFAAKIIPLGAKSISFWFKSSNASTYQVLIQNGRFDVDGEYGSTLVTYITTGKMYFIIRKSSIILSLPTSINVCDGVLRHFVITWNGTTTANAAKLYIDGVLNAQATASDTESTASTNNMIMGVSANNSSYPLTGSLDDISIFSRALTTAEVLTLYREQSSSGFFALLGGL